MGDSVGVIGASEGANVGLKVGSMVGTGEFVGTGIIGDAVGLAVDDVNCTTSIQTCPVEEAISQDTEKK